MTTVGIIVAAALTYIVIGCMTAAYATHRHEKHERNCEACGWQLLGAIWPLYWPATVLMLIYNRTLDRLEAGKLPKAQVQVKKENTR